MMVEKAKGGKKNRKVGRNAAHCKAYADRGQRGRNKVVKLRRRVARHPMDCCAKEALVRYEKELGPRMAA